ncbi:DUF996 domain-containing protein [Aquifex sp.]
MDELRRAKRWGVWGAVLIFVAVIFGIWSGYEVTRFNEELVEILDLLSKTLGLLGTIALVVSTYFYGKAFGRPEIFRNFLLGIILQIVAEVVLTVGVLTAVGPAGFSPNAVFWALMFLSYALWVFTAYLFKKSLSALGESLNYRLFKLAGSLIFWGGVLSILVIGLFIMLVGWILALIGFLRAPVEELQKSS